MVWRSVDFEKSVERIYPAAALQESLMSPNFFNVCAILTPTNETGVKVNGDLLGQLLGEVLTFHGDESGNVDDPGHEEMTGKAMATINCGDLHFLFSVSRLVLR
jgi:hypothetical protein